MSRRRPEYDRSDNYDLYVVEATAGAEPRQLTTFQGPDGEPEWGSRAPAWSPDGSLIAYVQGGPLNLIYYAVQKLAVVPAAGGPARVLTTTLDRNVLSPTFSSDGASVLFLLEGDRVYHLARVPAAGGAVERAGGGRPRALTDLLGRPRRAHGRRVRAARRRRARSTRSTGASSGRSRRQNDAWLRQVRLAPVEQISVRSKDGTEIHGFMVKPPDYQAGRRYPTILRIHGGPVWQYYHDFANLDWQVLAAQGYVVLGVNPRGSSGRGEKFATAIWAKWGQKDGEDVLAAVDWAVRAGHRRSRSSRRRRLELRRDPHRRGHRARPPLQGGDQRRGQGQRARRVRHRPVRQGVRGRAGHAVEEPQGVPRGLVPVPPRRPHRDPDPVPLRRPGLERAADQLRADVPGAQEPGAGDRSSSCTRASRTRSTSPATGGTGWSATSRGTGSISGAERRARRRASELGRRRRPGECLARDVSLSGQPLRRRRSVTRGRAGRHPMRTKRTSHVAAAGRTRPGLPAQGRADHGARIPTRRCWSRWRATIRATW